jgi:hypothetical protein
MFEILNTCLHVIIVIHVYQVYTKKILQTLSYIYNLPLNFFSFSITENIKSQKLNTNKKIKNIKIHIYKYVSRVRDIYNVNLPIFEKKYFDN